MRAMGNGCYDNYNYGYSYFLASRSVWGEIDTYDISYVNYNLRMISVDYSDGPDGFGPLKLSSNDSTNYEGWFGDFCMNYHVAPVRAVVTLESDIELKGSSDAGWTFE